MGYGGAMVLFGILLAINLAAALVAFGFFVVGLADGSVTTFNILIWGAMLGVLFSVPMAAWLLRVRGQARLASAVLVPLAGVAVLGGLALAVLVISAPDWR